MDIISIIVVAFVTITAIVAGFYAYGMSHLNEIKQNWVKYRCNPIYMPLARAVGSDIMTNFTSCTMQSVQSYAGFVMDPVFNLFKDFQEVFAYILNSMQFIRQKMAGTVDAFLGIVHSVFGKLQNTLSITASLFGRIRTIINRIISIFVIMINIAGTGVKTGQSIQNGPIGAVGEFLCFDPATPLKKYNGETIPMYDLKPGDVLYGGQTVESIMMFRGEATSMVNISGVLVSGNHKIFHKTRWIKCSEHPNAARADSIPLLLCLNTSTHTINISGMLFKDYEETDDVEHFYQDVADYYNSDIPPLRTEYRTTGFDIENTNIRMEDGSVRMLKDILTGERIAKGGQVLGFIVHHLPHKKVELGKGIFAAPGTVLLDKQNRLSTAANFLYMPNQTTDDPRCMNLLTENAMIVVVDRLGNDFTCLDDQEVPDPAIHDKRDKKVIDTNNNGEAGGCCRSDINSRCDIVHQCTAKS